MKQAIGYVRVSTEEQHIGPDAQREAIRRWAAQNNVEIVRFFEDIGVSGGAALDRRVGLTGAMGALEMLGSGAVLVVAKRDRLARDTMLAAMIQRMVERAGSSVQSADGVGNEDTPEGQLMRSLIDAFAQYERELIRARTRAALATKKLRGERISGQAPFGYRFDADSKVVPDDNEHTIFRNVVKMSDNGWTQQQIAEALARRGVVNRNGKPITRRTVGKILTCGLDRTVGAEEWGQIA